MSELKVFEIRNNIGASAKILDLGARLIELNIPTANHGIINTVLGYQDTSEYRSDTMYHGAIVGRYANRIAGAKFTLSGEEHRLEKNSGENHLHGGANGTHQQLWQVEKQTHANRLTLSTSLSNDGYPGRLAISVHYELSDDNELKISWSGQCDSNSLFNLTSHGYFNLSRQHDIKQHYLQIPINHFTPSNEQQIPLGNIKSVDGTALDLRQFTLLAQVIEHPSVQIAQCGGLDHNWAGEQSATPTLRAQLFSPDSGLLMQVFATQPGLQCYTGNHLSGANVHHDYQGVCLEPQFYPDSPNQPQFPSCEIKANQVVSHSMTLRFSHDTLKNLTG